MDSDGEEEARSLSRAQRFRVKKRRRLQEIDAQLAESEESHEIDGQRSLPPSSPLQDPEDLDHSEERGEINEQQSLPPSSPLQDPEDLHHGNISFDESSGEDNGEENEQIETGGEEEYSSNETSDVEEPVDEGQVADEGWEEEDELNEAMTVSETAEDGSSSGSVPSSDHESGAEENGLFSLNDTNLDTVLSLSGGITARDIFVLTLGMSVRHNWTYENVIDHFTCQNAILELPVLPRSKNKLWSTLRNEASNELEYHVYCNRCKCYVGLRDKLKYPKKCPNRDNCSHVMIKSKVKCFIMLDLKKQLLRFLSIPGIAEHLKYSTNREKHYPDSIQDIFDSNEYKRLVDDKVITPGRDLTYIFNTDGVKVLKGSKLSGWPLYIRINELPPNLRQKFLFMAGVWVDDEGPNMNAFLVPFVSKANDLSVNGIDWKPDGNNSVCSKVVPMGACVDSKARFLLYNMSQFNGSHGCTVCDILGFWSGGNMRFPVLPPHDVPVPERRSEEQLRLDMAQAYRTGVPVKGVKGISALINLTHHKMTNGQAMDDLHTLYEGCAKHHTNLLMKIGGTPVVVKTSIINKRMKLIKTPTSISRKPGDIAKRGSWKGSEWRNFLLYYGCICFHDLVPSKHINHFALLSHAAFLLSQDEITPQELDTAGRLLEKYVELFEKYFGINHMFYNVHLLLHFKECVSNLGPTWSYSTFNFESWNRKCITEQVHSAQGPAQQIVHRHLIKQLVNTCLYTDVNISPNVKVKLQDMLGKSRREPSHSVGNVHFFGEGETKGASEEERIVLENEGYLVVQFTEYPSILYKGVDYEKEGFRDSNQLSSNKDVYTWQETFCEIVKFVSFVHQELEVTGAFLLEYYVEPIQNAQHIVKIVPPKPVLHFTTVQQFRSPVISLKLGQSAYRVALANCHEID